LATKRSSRPRGLSHGNLRQRGRGWEYRFSLGGRSFSVSIRAETLAQAVSRANELYTREERRAGLAATGVPVDWTFRDLFEDFRENAYPDLKESTRATYEVVGWLFCEFAEKQLGNPKVPDFRGFHVQRYLEWRRNAKQSRYGEKTGGDRRVSIRTLQKDRTVLHRIFDRAVKLEIRESNPVTKTDPIKSRRRIPRLPTPEQVRALVEELSDPMARLYALTLVETGARSESECLRLRWEDVDFTKRRLWIRETKTNKPREVPISTPLLLALRAHFLRYRNARYNGKTSEWIFHHVRNRRRAKAGDRIKSLRRSIQQAATKVGIDWDFHVHDLRHWRITRWLAEGKPLIAVQKAVGHSDPRTTGWYAHVYGEDLDVLID